MTNTLSVVGVILFLALCAACWWMATGDVDNVQTMSQADYERAQCIGSQLPECRAQQVAGK